MEQEIKRIVEENSGGVKFTKLISEMTAAKQSRVDPDAILKTIEEMDGIQILRYSWYLAEAFPREKIFIFTP